MKHKENSHGFQYNGYQRCSRLSSDQRTNGLQVGSEQEIASYKDWRLLEGQKDHIDQMFDQVLNEKIDQLSL